MALTSALPGVHIAAIALMAGVGTEALFIVVVSRSTVRRVLASGSGPQHERLSIWDVFRYHLPLAATSLLTLMAQPLIGAGLARMPHPEENLAAWPVIWGILFLFRSAPFALPEAVIALAAERRLYGAGSCLLPADRHRVHGGDGGSGRHASARPLPPLRGRHPGAPRTLRFARHDPGGGDPVHQLSSQLVPRPADVLAHDARHILGDGFEPVDHGGARLRGCGLHTPGAETAIVALTLSLVAEVCYLRRQSVAGLREPAAGGCRPRVARAGR